MKSRKAMDINEFIFEYWSYVATQNEEKLKNYFSEDACIRWHNTNEQFNVEEFLRANCDYPESWNGEVQRIEYIGNKIITVAHIWSKESDISVHVTSFFELIDGKIKTLDEYWGDDGTPPKWRLDKKIGIPIQ
ncbi:nuclear transport factor 2 family protein [Irregularibacter muris]